MISNEETSSTFKTNFSLSKWPNLNKGCLVIGPYSSSEPVNRVILSQDYMPRKCFYDIGLLAPNRYKLDLSNEILNIPFCQGAAKSVRSWIYGRKKDPAMHRCVGVEWIVHNCSHALPCDPSWWTIMCLFTMLELALPLSSGTRFISYVQWDTNFGYANLLPAATFTCTYRHLSSGKTTRA